MIDENFGVKMTLDGSKYRPAGRGIPVAYTSEQAWRAAYGLRDIETSWGESWHDAKTRADAKGMATAHEYLAYRTALRADYAAALRIPDRAPATYLPLLNAFRTATRTT